MLQLIASLLEPKPSYLKEKVRLKGRIENRELKVDDKIENKPQTGPLR